MFLDPLRGLQHNRDVLIEIHRGVEIPPGVHGDATSCAGRAIAVFLAQTQICGRVKAGPKDVVSLDRDPYSATQKKYRPSALTACQLRHGFAFLMAM